MIARGLCHALFRFSSLFSSKTFSLTASRKKLLFKRKHQHFICASVCTSSLLFLFSRSSISAFLLDTFFTLIFLKKWLSSILLIFLKDHQLLSLKLLVSLNCRSPYRFGRSMVHYVLHVLKTHSFRL